MLEDIQSCRDLDKRTKIDCWQVWKTFLLIFTEHFPSIRGLLMLSNFFNAVFRSAMAVCISCHFGSKGWAVISMTTSEL